LALELEIRGLDSACRRYQVRNLLFGCAGSAPLADVASRWRLNSVLDLANPGEMLAGRDGQCPPGKARVLANLPETGT
jgi:hypothetical protein